MHELSIALAILDVVNEEVGARPASSVRVVYLKLGALSGVVKQALLSAYELAREGSELATSRLEVEEVAIQIQCETCDEVRPVRSPLELICKVCGAPASRVVAGQELEISALEFEE